MKCSNCGYDDKGTGDFAHVCGPVSVMTEAERLATRLDCAGQSEAAALLRSQAAEIERHKTIREKAIESMRDSEAQRDKLIEKLIAADAEIERLNEVDAYNTVIIKEASEKIERLRTQWEQERNTSDMLARENEALRTEASKLECDYTDQVLRAMKAEEELKALRAALVRIEAHRTTDMYWAAGIARDALKQGETP